MIHVRSFLLFAFFGACVVAWEKGIPGTCLLLGRNGARRLGPSGSFFVILLWLLIMPVVF